MNNPQQTVTTKTSTGLGCVEQVGQSVDSSAADVMNLPPEGQKSNAPRPSVDMGPKTKTTKGIKKPHIGPKKVKVHTLIAGETFDAHNTFMEKLNQKTKLCSAENSKVILVFCPVVSRIVIDMEAAMARVTADKPVILVLMHHCHDPSHMSEITVEPPWSRNVQVVHCVFHESLGLLQCKENEKAVIEVKAMLKKFK